MPAGEAPAGRRKLRVGLAFLASRHLFLAFLNSRRSSLDLASTGWIWRGEASSEAELPLSGVGRLDPVGRGFLHGAS
jgi:hypothetical protein